MPELPEVETTRLGITPHLIGQRIFEVIIRRYDLRWPISPELADWSGSSFKNIERRSKYLIFSNNRDQSLLLHLGMSGSLRIVPSAEEWKKHDHFSLSLENGNQLRYHDPRRFGLALVIPSSDILTHSLIQNLGPEPLGKSFTSEHLLLSLRKTGIPIKTAIMNAKIVVGVGNIYASESLFRAGIKPHTPANQVTEAQAKQLVSAIREVLQESITQGGTTLRDFTNSDGKPGYFQQRLYVYNRKKSPCRACGTDISYEIMNQRATYWCATCQK